MDKTLLVQLLDAVTVSVNEEEGQDIALEFGKSFSQKQYTDAVGNAVSVVNPEADCRVLLCGHMD